jgi:aminoglycoside phosphotransferase (APT) family kinase protein
MTLKGADNLLVQVLVRELTELGKRDPEPRNTIAVAAQLLRTLCTRDSWPVGDDKRRLDARALSDYLGAKGIVPSGTVLEVSRTPMGFSKDTFLVRVPSAGEDSDAGFVVRRDLAASAVPGTVVNEYPLLCGLYRAGFPVAEPLVLESDPRPLAQPFIVTRMLAGEAGHGVGLSSPEEGRDIGLKLADLLAELHACSPAQLGADPALTVQSPEQTLRDYFAGWRAVYDGIAGDSLPTMARAFDWVQQLPYVPERLSLVHGDVDFTNMLMSGGQMHGLIDWEFAHWGDPVEDLGYVRASLEKRMSWAEFLDRYRERGGVAPSAGALHFYELWRALRTVTTCLLARQAFDSGLNTDMRMAFAGRIILLDWVARVESLSVKLT